MMKIMYRILLVATAVAAQETMMPSDMPSDVPSMVPSSMMEAESSLPTIMGFPPAETAEPTASPVTSEVPPPSSGECTIDSCTLVPTWGGVSNFITEAASGDMLCMCGRLYEAGSCGGAATLATDKDITLECAPFEICSFDCLNPAFEVNAGSLTLKGTESNFVFTGGERFSRVVVNEAGSFIASNVMFQDTQCKAAEAPEESGRRMQGSFARGGGIETYGSTTVTDSTFDNCLASADGGAVYVGGGAATFRGVTFSNNVAFSGGAIYAQAGSVIVEGSTFEGNEAINTMSDPDVFAHEEATVEACDNESGNSDISGSCSGAAAIFAVAGSTVLAMSLGAMAMIV